MRAGDLTDRDAGAHNGAGWPHEPATDPGYGHASAGRHIAAADPDRAGIAAHANTV